MHITLLHLSDIQFGRHHANDSGGRTPLYEENNYDAESQKLISDFKILKKFGVNPNYLVLSGDIAETSTEDEYTLATGLLNKGQKWGQVYGWKWGHGNGVKSTVSVWKWGQVYG